MVSLVPLPVFAGHLEDLDISKVLVPRVARRDRVVLKNRPPTRLQNTAWIKAGILTTHLHRICGSCCASRPTDRERGSEGKAECGNLLVVAT